MILVLDNYDSFVHNLARYIHVLGYHTEIHRSDQLSIGDVIERSPQAIIISPGPCTPNEAGISVPLIQQLGSEIPILGICLGHQAIGQAYGGKIKKAMVPAHGKARVIHHTGEGLFKGIASPLSAGCYHSLVVAQEDFPKVLIATSHTDEGQVMSLQHRDYPVYGVQFHPESILTETGAHLLNNFLDLL